MAQSHCYSTPKPKLAPRPPAPPQAIQRDPPPSAHARSFTHSHTAAHTASRTVVERSRRWVETPARYETRESRVLVSPGGWVWKRRLSTSREGGDPLSGAQETLCKVWMPGRYAVSRSRVMVDPGHGEWRTTTRTRTLTQDLSRATTVQRSAKPAAGAWLRVACPPTMSPAALKRLQRALIARGYDPGPADGVSRPKTIEALRRFQRDHPGARPSIAARPTPTAPAPVAAPAPHRTARNNPTTPAPRARND